MTEGKTPVLLALPKLPGLENVTGQKPFKCTLCTRILYVSPGGQELLATGAVPVCPVCASRDVEHDAEAHFTQAIRDEVEDHTGESPEKIMGGIEPNVAVMMLADKIITIEGQIERGEISA